jgi:tRNA-splicing ligase RtcB
MPDNRLLRIDAARLRLRHSYPFDVRIFANDQVAIEPVAVDELMALLDAASGINRVAITPDFHKGAGVPIGTVLETCSVLFPQAVGKDINCGMRLHATNLDAGDLGPRLKEIAANARRLFFEGGRQIPMTGRDRETLLTEGLAGLFAASPWDRLGGQWPMLPRLNWHRQLDRIERCGSLPARLAGAFSDWVRERSTPSYDDQTGSIGGGNHFVEIQRVERILDRQTAFAWGLKQGSVTIMVHSGSVGIGHIAGRSILDLLKGSYPKSLAHPESGIYPLTVDAAAIKGFWDLLHNAANFAFANRLALAMSAVEAIDRVLGTFEAPLVYDAPHNFVWQQAGDVFLHRKGATPARGPQDMEGTPFHIWGEPVLVPGSMGSSSFVLAGLGNPEALNSASHGAGRALSRGQASRTALREFDRFLDEFHIVTPLDLNRADLRGRADIVKRKIEELRAEGPHAYKGIRAIIDTLSMAGIAKPVAELTPLMTIKG